MKVMTLDPSDMRQVWDFPELDRFMGRPLFHVAWVADALVDLEVYESDDQRGQLGEWRLQNPKFFTVGECCVLWGTYGRGIDSWLIVDPEGSEVRLNEVANKLLAGDRDE